MTVGRPHRHSRASGNPDGTAQDRPIIHPAFLDSRLRGKDGRNGPLPRIPAYAGISQERTYNPRLIPPRLALNCAGNDRYAGIYHWMRNPANIQGWIHQAFERKKRQLDPATSNLDLFANNRTTDPLLGWQN